MKKSIIAIFVTVFTVSIVHAQKSNYDRWSVSYALGSHFLTKPSSTPKADLRNLHISHHDVNGRFMMNNRLGVMMDLGYDMFEYAGMKKQKTHYIRTSFQAVINAGDGLKLNTIHHRLGLLLHGGIGGSVMWQKFPKKTANDYIINLIVGATPQLRIAQRWSLKGDLSLIANYKQNKTFDFKRKLSSATDPLGHTGIFFNLSVGVTYHIGSNGNHLDWVPTFSSIGGESRHRARF